MALFARLIHCLHTFLALSSLSAVSFSLSRARLHTRSRGIAIPRVSRHGIRWHNTYTAHTWRMDSNLFNGQYNSLKMEQFSYTSNVHRHTFATTTPTACIRCVDFLHYFFSNFIRRVICYFQLTMVSATVAHGRWGRNQTKQL